MIRYFENASSSPLFHLVPRAVLELLSEGLLPDYDPTVVYGNDAMFVSYDEDTGKPVAFLAYRPDAMRSSWWILLSYTLPAYRSLGHHTRLFEACIDRAKSKGDIKRIDCGTHVHNHAAQDAFARQGRVMIGQTWSFEIRPAADGETVQVLPDHVKAFMTENDSFRVMKYIINEGVAELTLKNGAVHTMTEAEFDALPGKYPI